jgi:hypothetical protein
MHTPQQSARTMKNRKNPQLHLLTESARNGKKRLEKS